MDCLNEYFANVGPKLHESINQSPRIAIMQQVQSFYLKHTDDNDLSKIIGSMKMKISTAKDDLSTKIVKVARHVKLDPRRAVISYDKSKHNEPNILRSLKGCQSHPSLQRWRNRGLVELSSFISSFALFQNFWESFIHKDDEIHHQVQPPTW